MRLGTTYAFVVGCLLGWCILGLMLAKERKPLTPCVGRSHFDIGQQCQGATGTETYVGGCGWIPGAWKLEGK